MLGGLRDLGTLSPEAGAVCTDKVVIKACLVHILGQHFN